MSEIEYIFKPEHITYDEIFEIVYQAHAGNREQGMIINPGIHNGAEFEAHLGDDHVCILAMDNDRIAGTVSVRIEKGTRRITKGLRTAYLMNMAVREQYRGQGIGLGLIDRLAEYAKGEDADAIVLYVVARNKAVSLYKKAGFIEADFLARRTLKQNSIYMLKWLGEPRIPDRVIKLYYTMRKTYLTWRYRFQ